MLNVRLGWAVAVPGVCALSLASCGGSSSGGSPGGGSSGAAPSPSRVQSCLQQAGYGVTQVPTAEVAPSGEENRGPGQTGELWVGLARKAPQTADDAAAIVAFWDSAAHAASAPNGPVSDLNRHAFAVGAVTVQPANPLLASIAKTHPVHSQAEAQAAVKSGLGKIESCLH